MDMERISESLKKFYEYNHINPELYTSDMMEAYTQDKYCDTRIAQDKLRERVDGWLEGFREEDRGYFLDLLEHYHYLSERELKYRLAVLCSYIFDKLRLSEIEKSEVLFVTVPSANGTAGGGDFMRNYLLSVNLEWGIYKGQIISDISRADEDILEGKKAIIFVDDILGTGFSVKETIKVFLERFPKIDKGGYSWGIAGVMVMKSAVRYIKKNAEAMGISLEIYAQEKNYIKSCMKGNYIFDEKVKSEIEEIIIGYEKQIGLNEETGEDFVMGFRACKLLLSFCYNTPNNTLCNFWKYTEKNTPVFPRDKHMRPTIEALKQKKKHYKSNAYLKGCVEHENV